MAELVFIDEPVLVETRILPSGEVEPRTFAWQGRAFRITGSGRQWSEDLEGQTWRCFLVQADGDSYELRYNPAAGQWRLARAWRSRRLT